MRGGDDDGIFRFCRPKTEVGDVGRLKRRSAALEVTLDPMGLGLRLR